MWSISLVLVLGLLFSNSYCESFYEVAELEDEVDVWERQFDAPSVDNFRRRALHSSK